VLRVVLPILGGGVAQVNQGFGLVFTWDSPFVDDRNVSLASLYSLATPSPHARPRVFAASQLEHADKFSLFSLTRLGIVRPRAHVHSVRTSCVS
jgi:hypothetical protein